ncbi:hypothetical protein OMDBNIEC_00089 [Salmonella phage STP-SP5]|nr:hypothetical protein OMDBNIEC_00089 [Salmonella phage STP-SP5]
MHQLSSTSKAKLPGWQTRLLTTIEGLKNTPFEWGQIDCCIFAAKCIDAQYGTDIASTVIGQYNSELSCKRYMIKRAKTASLATVLDTFLPVRVNVKYAQRGDVVTFEGMLGSTAGVLWSDYVWAMGPDGVETIPLNKIAITDGWRI